MVSNEKLEFIEGRAGINLMRAQEGKLPWGEVVARDFEAAAQLVAEAGESPELEAELLETARMERAQDLLAATIPNAFNN